MKQSHLLSLCIFLCTLALTSCEEAEVWGPKNDAGNTEGVRTDAGVNIFASGEIGHISYFVRFDSNIRFKDGLWKHEDITYLGDTLEVTLVDKSGNTFTVEERYTQGSTSYLKAQNTPDIPVESGFLLTPTTKGWIVEPLKREKQAISLLFGYFEAFELPKQTKGNFMNIEQWEDKFDLELLDSRYSSVSLSYNYGPMAYDGAGLQWFYTDSKEMIRMAFIGAMIPHGSGWDWLTQ